MDKKIVYSGIQPTGNITIGNYIGAIKNWLSLQDDETTQCIYSIVDLHSLTVKQVPSELRQRSVSFFAQYLAMGLDPNKNIMYYQSHVHEHAALTWILNCMTYIGEASRMTQFKEKSKKNADNLNMGLMDYPVLMAADILLYGTNYVPIGVDQKQHLELARDLAERFNSRYSETFAIPEPFIGSVGAKIMSLQEPTKKMSKSEADANASILLLDDSDTIMRKIKRAVTDSDGEVRIGEDKPGVTNLVTIYSAFTDKTMDEALKDLGGMNYGSLKVAVADSIIAKLAPIRAKYEEYMADKAYIAEIAKQGAERASAIASKTLRKVYKKVGLYQY